MRLDLVSKVFPKSKFIHIIRDGRDVAVSKEEIFGDIRKISSQKTLTENSKIGSLIFDEINHKIRNGLTLLMLVSNSYRYLRMVWFIRNKNVILGAQLRL